MYQPQPGDVVRINLFDELLLVGVVTAVDDQHAAVITLVVNSTNLTLLSVDTQGIYAVSDLIFLVPMG
jgi:hypothetical protein